MVVVRPGDAVSRETSAPAPTVGSRAPQPAGRSIADPVPAAAAAPAAVLTGSGRHAAPGAPEVEPSSPVPLLLQRAKRLFAKDFLEILRDLTPGGVDFVGSGDQSE